MKQTAVEWLINELIPKDQHEGIMDIIEEAKEMEKQQQEISDEEIELQSKKYGVHGVLFSDGAKWYREQLKSK